MSEYLIEQTSEESTLTLFNKRMLYKTRANQRTIHNGIDHVVDFNFGEMCYFGKLNPNLVPAYLKLSDSVVRITQSQNNFKNVQAVNFVAALFNEMKLKFETAVAQGKISGDDPFLSNLKAYKGYEDPIDEYLNYIDTIAGALKRNFKNNSIQVENFEHFMEEFYKIAPNFLENVPLTLSGYLKSRFNSVFSSGLAIEIADLDYENDHEKINMFYESENWDFFVQACDNYGFRIDRNIPWRIVCDVTAEQISEVIRDNGYRSGTIFLSSGLRSGVTSSLIMLPSVLKKIYDTVRSTAYQKTKSCRDGSIIKETVYSKTYDSGLIADGYLIDYFVKEYIKLRLIEEKVQIQDSHKRKLIKDVTYVCTSNASYAPLEILIEKKLNNMVDKHFTIDYYNYIQKPALLMREFRQGNIKAISLGEVENMATNFSTNQGAITSY